MIPKTKKDTLRILKNTIHYLCTIEIYGEESVEVAECLQFLQAWAKTAGLSKRDQETLKRRIEKKRFKGEM